MQLNLNNKAILNGLLTGHEVPHQFGESARLHMNLSKNSDFYTDTRGGVTSRNLPDTSVMSIDIDETIQDISGADHDTTNRSHNVNYSKLESIHSS